ncbi:putative protease [Hubei leech virus 1]|uniref:putative protease n=1 Tax=Hubei leech virus 1 TaxID=1922899 RepID=UPI00090B0F63|nr:putative protease [Hubei leech virus 1]APG79043.1 putative protease [Hubei leech virus 1]
MTYWNIKVIMTILLLGVAAVAVIAGVLFVCFKVRVSTQQAASLTSTFIGFCVFLWIVRALVRRYGPNKTVRELVMERFKKKRSKAAKGPSGTMAGDQYQVNLIPGVTDLLSELWDDVDDTFTLAVPLFAMGGVAWGRDLLFIQTAIRKFVATLPGWLDLPLGDLRGRGIAFVQRMHDQGGDPAQGPQPQRPWRERLRDRAIQLYEAGTHPIARAWDEAQRLMDGPNYRATLKKIAVTGMTACALFLAYRSWSGRKNGKKERDEPEMDQIVPEDKTPSPLMLREVFMSGSTVLQNVPRAVQGVRLLRLPENGSTRQSYMTCFKVGRFFVTCSHVEFGEGEEAAIALEAVPLDSNPTWLRARVLKVFPRRTCELADDIVVLECPAQLATVRSIPSRVAKENPIAGFVAGFVDGVHSIPAMSPGAIDTEGTHWCTTAPGASGSAVCDHAGVAIGVHYAGSHKLNSFMPFDREVLDFVKGGNSEPFERSVKRTRASSQPNGGRTPGLSPLQEPTLEISDTSGLDPLPNLSGPKSSSSTATSPPTDAAPISRSRRRRLARRLKKLSDTCSESSANAG